MILEIDIWVISTVRKKKIEKTRYPKRMSINCIPHALVIPREEPLLQRCIENHKCGSQTPKEALHISCLISLNQGSVQLLKVFLGKSKDQAKNTRKLIFQQQILSAFCAVAIFCLIFNSNLIKTAFSKGQNLSAFSHSRQKHPCLRSPMESSKPVTFCHILKAPSLKPQQKNLLQIIEYQPGMSLCIFILKITLVQIYFINYNGYVKQEQVEGPHELWFKVLILITHSVFLFLQIWLIFLDMLYTICVPC